MDKENNMKIEEKSFKSVGSALAYFRKSNNMTQNEVAKKMGLKTQSSVADIESDDKRIPAKKTIKKYCKAMGLDDNVLEFLYKVRNFCIKNRNNKEAEKYLVHENDLQVDFILTNDHLIKKSNPELVSVGSCEYPSGSYLVCVTATKYGSSIKANGFIVVNPTKKTVADISGYYLAVVNGDIDIIKMRREGELYIVERVGKETQIYTDETITKITIFGYIEDYLYRGKPSF